MLTVLQEARACSHCANALPHAPRPLVAGSRESRVLLIGQAPGQVAHDSGIPWNDRSGDRLRAWLGVTREQFYDERLIALMPMGFCFPGKGPCGDLPPRPECAPLWHPRLLAGLTRVELIVYIGRFSVEHYLADQFDSISPAVEAYDELLPARVALPHPSPRNNIWLTRNRWFERKLIPRLQAHIRKWLRDG